MYWHTADDTLDKLSPESLQIVGAVTSVLPATEAGKNSLPAPFSAQIRAKEEYYRTLDRDKVKKMLDQKYDFVLLDVLPAEYYEEAHIRGALNACIYDVNFLRQAEEMIRTR